MSLTGQTVLVTGASSGIGRAIALYLARLGARVALWGRNAQRLEETMAAMEGGPHQITALDLANTAAIDDGVQKVVETMGPLSAMVAAAGVVESLALRYQSIEEAERLMRINWLSVWALTKAFRVRRRHTTPASVVYVSSAAADVGAKTLSVYSASKGALNAMARALAAELAEEGIRVNCVAPGFVDTPMTKEYFARITPEQRAQALDRQVLGLGQPDDVAAAVAFLVSPASRWITASVLHVDGGYSSVR